MDASAGEPAAGGLVAPSELTSVVVYGEGAICTRRATLTLPPGGGGDGNGNGNGGSGGTVAVRVAGLPPSLLDGSLRGRVTEGPGTLRVTDIRVEYAAALRRRDDLPRLRLDLEDAEDRQTRARDRTQRLTAEIATTAALRAEPPAPRRGDAPRWTPVESILALANFVDSRLGTLHRKLREAQQEEEQADHAVDVLRHRLAEASSATDQRHAAPTATAVVTLARTDGEGSDDGDSEDGDDGDDGAGGAGGAGGTGEPHGLTLELEYQVPGARWTPLYQLRLDGRSDRGVLVLRAAVAQRTGEDWNGVRLGLSTADLLRRADLPRLRSLRIGRRQAEPAQRSWREAPAGLEELFAGYDSAAKPPPQLVGVRYGVASAGVGTVSVEDVYGDPRFPPPVPGPDDYALPLAGGGPVSPGGPPPAPASVPPPAPAAPRPPAQPAARSARGRGAVPTAAYGASAGTDPWADKEPAPVGPGAPGQPPSADEGFVPRDDLLDYARLTLAGPDELVGRGTLEPAPAAPHAVAAEFRRRAASVRELALPAHAVDVRDSAGSFDHRFDAAASVDVTADGGWHTVPVAEIPVGVEFGHVCAPCEDPAVFGTVEVANTSPHSLLGGPVDVMVDGDFVRTAPLPPLAAGQRQAVGLGVTESVKVARRAHMRESTAGLRGGTTVLDHSVEIDVANRLPYPVVVQVRERVPVSADKDVRVEEHRAEPAWTPATRPADGQEDAFVSGLRTWRVALEPGGTATLTGGYAIRLPAGKAVVGGNRRN